MNGAKEKRPHQRAFDLFVLPVYFFLAAGLAAVLAAGLAAGFAGALSVLAVPFLQPAMMAPFMLCGISHLRYGEKYPTFERKKLVRFDFFLKPCRLILNH